MAQIVFPDWSGGRCGGKEGVSTQLVTSLLLGRFGPTRALLHPPLPTTTLPACPTNYAVLPYPEKMDAHRGHERRNDII